MGRPGTAVHGSGLGGPRTDWPDHPKASRDRLHEAEMWVVEGLTHRYPTKVLAELLATCPQYCGHCTRMDLVGNDVPQVDKLKFDTPQKDRHSQILDYLRRTPGSATWSSRAATSPTCHISSSSRSSTRCSTSRTSGTSASPRRADGLPQHFLQDDVLRGWSAWRRRRSSGAWTSRCTAMRTTRSR